MKISLEDHRLVLTPVQEDPISQLRGSVKVEGPQDFRLAREKALKGMAYEVAGEGKSK